MRIMSCGRIKYKYVIIVTGIIGLAFYFLISRERTSLSLATEPKRKVSGLINHGRARTADLPLDSGLTNGRGTDINYGVNEERQIESREGAVDIYVVEEHHEVLPYWYEAANTGVIPKSGNTLIHFDGHSDLAPPSNVYGFPFFTWPKPSQIRTLLQSNDAFIQAAVITGLINRVIWVWPDWDVQNHDEQYVTMPIRLGWFLPLNETEKSLCTCATINNTYVCRSTSDFGMGVDDNGFEMPIHECKIMRTFIFEEVAESYAVQYFRKQFRLAEKSHVMLDMDEDYFGCTYAVMPLLQANVSLAKIKLISKRTAAFFCPKTTEHDHATDELLYSIIDLIRRQKQCNSNRVVQSGTSCRNLTDQNIKSKFVSELVWKNHTSVINLCHLRLTTMPTLINSIFQNLKKLSEKQLSVLQEVGFCSSTSPKSYSEEGGYTICMGANTPRNTAVLVHHPTDRENLERSKLLDRILKSIPKFTPKVVTVARSVRDGYTPREYFEGIEKDILSMLKSTFSNNVNTHYDLDLLGGAQGWPARRRTLRSANSL